MNHDTSVNRMDHPRLTTTIFNRLAIVGVALSFANLGATAVACSKQGLQSPIPAVTPLRTYTVGGPDENLIHTRVTKGVVTDGIRFSLTPSLVSARLGDPMIVTLWFSSPTEKSSLLCFQEFGESLAFSVRDSMGRSLLTHTPPRDKESLFTQRMRCVLPAEIQLRYVLPLSDYVAIDRPGEYTVFATLRADTAHRFGLIRSNSIVLHVTR